MNLKLKTALLSSVLFFSFSIPLVSQASSEKVNEFRSNIEINTDGTVDFQETIIYDFGDKQRHGIFRNLIYKRTNEDGKRYIMDIDNIGVTDGSGNNYRYQTSRKGNKLELKIGDPDSTITGQHTYLIKYKVSGALTYFSDHDEFYWNVSGNDWDVPIETYSANIKLPESINKDEIELVCYEGYSGSSSTSCSIDYIYGTALVKNSRVLSPGEGITVGISFPKGKVDLLEPREDKPGILFYLIMGVLAIASFFWFIFLPIKILAKYIKQRNFTRDHQRIVSAWFEPPQYESGKPFTPAETGFIVDRAIDHKELTATIIDLAQRGYLRIREDKKDSYTFIKLKDENIGKLRNFEKEVMRAIFEKGNEVRDKDLKKSTTLFTKISKFNKYVEDELVEKNMFSEKPSSVFMKNMALFGLALVSFNLPLALVTFILGRKSANRTLGGVEKYSEAESLYNFIKSQDEQLNFQSKNQMFFEKLLPYAVAFGVEKIWAERFKDISLAKPDWYEGSNFTNTMFVTNMTRNIGGSVRAASTMSSTRSSSGFSSGFSGGSSGGGGGGGGGGSW